MMEGVVRDLIYAARSIRRSPAISGAVILTLTVGLGATLAVVSLVDGVLLHPIPVPDAARVVRVFQAASEASPDQGTAYPTLEDYRTAGSGLEGPAGFVALDVGLRTGDVSDRVSAGLVTGDYFQVLRLSAAVGRTLQPADDSPDAPRVAVLGFALWQRAFGGDPGVVGRTISVSGTPFEVVGVARRGFRGVTLEESPELWLPLVRIQEAAAEGLYAVPRLFETRAFPWISMVARLPDDLEPASAERVLDRTAHGLVAELGDDSGLPDLAEIVHLRPLAAAAALDGRDGLLRFVGLLGVVVLMTLAVACLNAANLISARAWTRSRELGVRQALGARRGRLVRHLLSESLVLAAAGGAAGLGLAVLATRVLQRFALPGGIPLSRVDLSLDGRLVGVALGLSTLSAVAFGLIPALVQSRRDVGERLRRGGRTSSGGAHGLSILVGGQIGLSLVLVVGALLFVRTLESALNTDLGFEPEGLAAVAMGFRGQGYQDDEVPDAVSRVLASVEASPAVASAAFAVQVPLSPAAIRLRPLAEDAPDDEAGQATAINVVSSRYFETLGVPFLEGRTFGPADTRDAPDVAVINEAAARRLWPDRRALGQRLVLMRGLDPVEVVGIVRDHKVHGVTDEAVPYIYLSLTQSPQLAASRVSLVARATGDARDALNVLRDRLREFDPGLPLQDTRLVADQMDRVLMPQRFGALLLGLLGLVTLVVCAVGVFAMVTFGVRRRTREIGIRMALGAGPTRVAAAVVARAALAVAGGVAVGAGLAMVLTRYVGEYLFGVTPLDPTSFAAAIAVLSTTALVAALLPARRAVAIDPAEAVAGEV